MAKKKTNKNAKTLRPYLLNCLADTCQDFADLQSDFHSADVTPTTIEYGIRDEDRPRLLQLREDYLAHIKKILSDLDRLT